VRIALRAVTKGRRERALPETSVTFESGTPVLVCTETEQRPTVLGLIASGRMRPATGTVTVDGRTDAARLRRAVALVDALDVSEPEPNVSVAGVVAEELMFAGLRSHPLAARRWLDDLGLGAIASTPIGNVDPAQRIRILCELAALRPGVAGLVLTSPDRHGGDPAVWWHIAEEFAARGLAVLVITGRASELVLRVGASEDGGTGVFDEPEPEASERTATTSGPDDSTAILRLSADPPAEQSPDATEAGDAEPRFPDTARTQTNPGATAAGRIAADATEADATEADAARTVGAGPRPDDGDGDGGRPQAEDPDGEDREREDPDEGRRS
jgi:hypothetical protein